MAYWMAYRNNRGNYRNYKCSDCLTPASQASNKLSIVTDKRLRCGKEMSHVGVLAEVPVIKR